MQLLFRSRIFVVLSHFNGLFHFSSYGKMNLMFESVHRIALKRYIRYGEIKFSPVRGVNIQKDFLFQERFAMFREISFFRIHTSKTRIDISLIYFSPFSYFTNVRIRVTNSFNSSRFCSRYSTIFRNFSRIVDKNPRRKQISNYLPIITGYRDYCQIHFRIAFQEDF